MWNIKCKVLNIHMLNVFKFTFNTLTFMLQMKKLNLKLFSPGLNITLKSCFSDLQGGRQRWEFIKENKKVRKKEK